MNKGVNAALFCALLMLGGCSAKKPPDSAFVYDLQTFPQDASAYADNIEDRSNLLALQQAYETHYFEPWHYRVPPQDVEEVLWPFSSYTPEKMFGENLRPLPTAWYERMREEANFAAYGTMNAHAVTLRYTSLRNFPTHKPLFKDPRSAGEGFPFDYLQNSGVHPNEPLFVSHLSKDAAWAYVFSAYATGWVRVHEIALIPEQYVKEWQEARQLHIVRDDFPIYDEQGRFVFYGRVGMLMPLISVEEQHFTALAVTPGANGEATYTPVHVSKSAGREAPLPLNSDTLPSIANELLQSRYGWGGLYGERDCSSTLRDMYAPFGIWLPRNSAQQADVGRQVLLAGLDDAVKLEKIRQEGVPFETLLYRKGHILLYLGSYNGEVMVLHNVWGVKTKNGDKEGRKIIGKTVISTLKLGCEQPDYDEENALLKKIERMNILTAR